MLGGGFAIYGIIGCFLGIMSIPLWLSHLATTEKFTSFLWLSFLVLCVGYSSYYLFAGGEKYLFDADSVISSYNINTSNVFCWFFYGH